MKNKHYKTTTSASKAAAAALAVMMAVSGQAGAVSLLSGLGGTSGYGELAMLPNDDSSSNQLALPFEINFYGNHYNNFFINNNGNITFNAAVGSYTPEPFPIANQPMIAPFWADVDTRGTGNVYVAAPNQDTMVVTWNNVGYYRAHTDLTNNFQLVLQNQQNGNFDIQFRYDQLNWVTGDASGGTGGFGGTPAQAGFDAGNGTDYFIVPGSFTDTIHTTLANNTNVAGGDPGFWSFAIREGNTPGSTADNPLMPVVVDGSFQFEFGVTLNQTVFIDPLVAVGYDYVVSSGPNIASVLLPTGIGDGLYNLHLWNGSSYVFSSVVAGGTAYDFGPGGVDRFRIDGIEVSAALDPTDPLAFVTGLTFVDSGIVRMTQTPISLNTTPGQNVPEPALFALLGMGLAFSALRRRRV